jgi:hypothetical protein
MSELSYPVYLLELGNELRIVFPDDKADITAFPRRSSPISCIASGGLGSSATSCTWEPVSQAAS